MLSIYTLLMYVNICSYRIPLKAAKFPSSKNTYGNKCSEKLKSRRIYKKMQKYLKGQNPTIRQPLLLKNGFYNNTTIEFST